MKSQGLKMVLTADQVSSRRDVDRVPHALDALAQVAGLTLPFERTAGDEIQALVARPSAIVDAVTRLTRLGGWRIGIGVGVVDDPLPSSTREARGSAYVAAREAISRARRLPGILALSLPSSVRVDPYREGEAHDAETALMALRVLLERRTDEGWEVVDLIDSGLTGTQAAHTLGVSPSAVSQRLARSGRVECDRVAALATRLLDRVLTGQP